MHLAAEPLPKTIVFGWEPQSQSDLVGFHRRLEEMQVQEVDVALVLVKAVALGQAKHVKVVPRIIMAEVGPQSHAPFQFHISEVGTHAQADELILLPVYVPAVPQVKHVPLLSKTTLAAALQDAHEVPCQIFVPEHRHPPLPSPPVVPEGQATQKFPLRYALLKSQAHLPPVSVDTHT